MKRSLSVLILDPLAGSRKSILIKTSSPSTNNFTDATLTNNSIPSTEYKEPTSIKIESRPDKPCVGEIIRVSESIMVSLLKDSPIRSR